MGMDVSLDKEWGQAWVHGYKGTIFCGFSAKASAEASADSPFLLSFSLQAAWGVGGSVCHGTKTYYQVSLLYYAIRIQITSNWLVNTIQNISRAISNMTLSIYTNVDNHGQCENSTILNPVLWIKGSVEASANSPVLFSFLLSAAWDIAATMGALVRDAVWCGIETCYQVSLL